MALKLVLIDQSSTSLHQSELPNSSKGIWDHSPKITYISPGKGGQSPQRLYVQRVTAVALISIVGFEADYG